MAAPSDYKYYYPFANDLKDAAGNASDPVVSGDYFFFGNALHLSEDANLELVPNTHDSYYNTQNYTATYLIRMDAVHANDSEMVILDNLNDDEDIASLYHEVWFDEGDSHHPMTDIDMIWIDRDSGDEIYCEHELTSPIRNGNDIHIAFSFSPTSQKMYVNGVLVKTCSNSTVLPDIDTIVVLGRTYTGFVSHYRFYDRTLSDSEVHNIYEEDKPYDYAEYDYDIVQENRGVALLDWFDIIQGMWPGYERVAVDNLFAIVQENEDHEGSRDTLDSYVVRQEVDCDWVKTVPLQPSTLPAPTHYWPLTEDLTDIVAGNDLQQNGAAFFDARGWLRVPYGNTGLPLTTSLSNNNATFTYDIQALRDNYYGTCLTEQGYFELSWLTHVGVTGTNRIHIAGARIEMPQYHGIRFSEMLHIGVVIENGRFSCYINGECYTQGADIQPVLGDITKFFVNDATLHASGIVKDVKYWNTPLKPDQMFEEYQQRLQQCRTVHHVCEVFTLQDTFEIMQGVELSDWVDVLCSDIFTVKQHIGYNSGEQVDTEFVFIQSLVKSQLPAKPVDGCIGEINCTNTGIDKGSYHNIEDEIAHRNDPLRRGAIYYYGQSRPYPGGYLREGVSFSYVFPYSTTDCNGYIYNAQTLQQFDGRAVSVRYKAANEITDNRYLMMSLSLEKDAEFEAGICIKREPGSREVHLYLAGDPVYWYNRPIHHIGYYLDSGTYTTIIISVSNDGWLRVFANLKQISEEYLPDFFNKYDTRFTVGGIGVEGVNDLYFGNPHPLAGVADRLKLYNRDLNYADVLQIVGDGEERFYTVQHVQPCDIAVFHIAQCVDKGYVTVKDIPSVRPRLTFTWRKLQADEPVNSRFFWRYQSWYVKYGKAWEIVGNAPDGTQWTGVENGNDWQSFFSNFSQYSLGMSLDTLEWTLAWSANTPSNKLGLSISKSYYGNSLGMMGVEGADIVITPDKETGMIVFHNAAQYVLPHQWVYYVLRCRKSYNEYVYTLYIDDVKFETTSTYRLIPKGDRIPKNAICQPYTVTIPASAEHVDNEYVATKVGKIRIYGEALSDNEAFGLNGRTWGLDFVQHVQPSKAPEPFEIVQGVFVGYFRMEGVMRNPNPTCGSFGYVWNFDRSLEEAWGHADIVSRVQPPYSYPQGRFTRALGLDRGEYRYALSHPVGRINGTTVSFWWKGSTTDGGDILVFLGAAVGEYHWINIESGVVRFYSQQYWELMFEATLPENEWVMVTIRQRFFLDVNENDPDEIRIESFIAINDSIVDRDTRSGSINGWNNIATGFAGGQRFDIPYYPYYRHKPITGQIDQLRIQDCAMEEWMLPQLYHDRVVPVALSIVQGVQMHTFNDFDIIQEVQPLQFERFDLTQRADVAKEVHRLDVVQRLEVAVSTIFIVKEEQ